MKSWQKRGWYALELPDRWLAEERKGEPAAFRDPEGAGVLHAAVQQPGPLKPGERIDVFLFMRAFLRGVGVTFETCSPRRFTQNGAEGAACEFSGPGPEGRVFERLWFLTNHQFVLFLTYYCSDEDREAERALVDGIVASVKLLG